MKLNSMRNFSSKRKLLINLMRTFILLFCTSVFSFTNINVFSQNAKITINNTKTVTVDEVFRILKKQTDYTFIYQEDLFKNAPKVTLKKGIISANKLLSQSLGDTFEVLYDEPTKTLAVRVTTKNTSTETQDTYTLEGTVTDVNGLPIPGVTVIYMEHPNRSTSADINGKYKLRINENETATVQFSSVGFITESILVEGRKKINVVLKEQTTTLEEIVIIGYGTQKRSEVSSSVSSVKSENISKNLGGNVSFDRGLSGLVKGVQIAQGSGQPGSGVDINIRGITSPFAGSDNNPLFVIDGVPFQTNPAFSFRDDTSNNQIPNPLQTINPNDIESIDVLKDASATAIYGSRGANGVIIVKTKKGKKGEKTKVAFSTNTTFAKPINKPKYLNTQQYKDRIVTLLKNSAEFANQTQNNSLIYAVNGYSYLANVPIDFASNTVSFQGLKEEWFGNANTDWVDLAYRNPAITNQYNLSITGGSEKTGYGVSLGHTDQEGLLLNDKYKQYNFRTSLDTQVNKFISAGFNANLSYSDNATGYDNTNSWLNSEILSARPDIAPYDKFGNFNRLPGLFRSVFEAKLASPLAKTMGYNFNTESFSVLGNAYLEIEPFENFKLRSDINVGRFSNNVNNYNPATIVENIIPDQGLNGTSANSTLTTSSTVSSNIIANLTANYTKTLGDKHNFSALVGVAWDRSYSDRSNFVFSGFPDDKVLTNATAALNTLGKAESEIETGLNSIFSRVSYNFDEKYFLTLNFRTDRSVKFGPKNQRGYFPSVSASWNLTNENFLRNNPKVNDLRLRVGYGQSGSNNIQDFAYLQFWSVGFRDEGLYNGEQAVGLSSTLPNEAIKWETTTELNVGVDFAFFNNRLSGSFDVYNRKTKDALMGGLYPLESGASQFTENFANLTNKGFEIDLYGDVIRNESFTWSLGFNLAKNINTLDKFNEAALASSFIKNYYEIGREVNIIRGYITDGYFQNQSEIDKLNASAPEGVYQETTTAPGDYKYVDLNGDGKITTEDQKYLGSAQPDFFGGFNSFFSYKAFDLSANFSYSLGGETTLSADNNGLGGTPTRNIETRYLDTWTPENPNAAYPRAILGGGAGLNLNTRASSALVHSTSFLRLQSLQLRYNLPTSVTNSLGLSNLSLDLTGTNLWTKTNFPGLDPASISGLASTTGIRTSDPYPIAKTWAIGVNVNF